MNVGWNKCQGNVWCKLNEVDLSHNHFDNMRGVYVIWYNLHNPEAVRVGQGFIRDRLQAHRHDQDVQYYAHLGLYVTWARVPENSLNGVEAYLAQNLNPLVGEQFPNVPLISVNLPW